MTATQTTVTGQTAVKSLDFFVGQQFSDGFFDSCKNVKFGVTNDYAMTFIGGGAKTSKAFLKYLGDKKDLGSSDYALGTKIADHFEVVQRDQDKVNIAQIYNDVHH